MYGSTFNEIETEIDWNRLNVEQSISLYFADDLEEDLQYMTKWVNKSRKFNINVYWRRTVKQKIEGKYC